MLEDDDADLSESSFKNVDLLAQLNRLNLDDENVGTGPSAGPAVEQVARASSKILVRTNEVFDMHRASSKMKKVLEITKDILAKNEKVILVSQWTSLLNILKEHLAAARISFVKLAGDIPVKNRNDIVVDFNQPAGPKVIAYLNYKKKKILNYGYI